MVWRDLEFGLTYPPHTQRADKTLKNPTGPLKVPAGTRVELTFVPRETHAYAWAERIPCGVHEHDVADRGAPCTPPLLPSLLPSQLPSLLLP